jgi:plasmid stabilization system protein ParE
MTRAEFEVWSREAEKLREEFLRPYNRASGEEERKRIVAELEERLKRLAE